MFAHETNHQKPRFNRRPYPILPPIYRLFAVALIALAVVQTSPAQADAEKEKNLLPSAKRRIGALGGKVTTHQV